MRRRGYFPAQALDAPYDRIGNERSSQEKGSHIGVVQSYTLLGPNDKYMAARPSSSTASECASCLNHGSPMIRASSASVHHSRTKVPP